MPPWSTVLTSASALPYIALVSGLFVMMRIVPDCELAPYSVPCGPASDSTRSTS